MRTPPLVSLLSFELEVSLAASVVCLLDRMMDTLLVLTFAVLAQSASAFTTSTPFISSPRAVGGRLPWLHASGEGFGSNSRGGDNGIEKTYDTSVTTAIKDLIDVEAAMKEFFESNEEWSPLFRSIALSSAAPAMSFLGGSHGESIDFDCSSSPWNRLKEIPSDDKDMAVLASFLDSMQQSLIDIPTNELVKEDENDLHFLEEGRRMLALTRFHVIRDNSGGSVENFDSLFSTCWSELAMLASTNEENTGALILLPEYSLADLRRFSDMNLLRPLQWLGMDSAFEVAIMQREVPAIRVLYKLGDMPPDSYDEESEDNEEL